MTHADTDDAPAGPNANLLERADIAAARRLARHRDHSAARAVTAIGGIKPVLAAAGAVVAWGLLTGDRRSAWHGGRMLTSVLLATVLKATLKLVVARTRPHMLLDKGVHEVRLLGPNEKSWRSFPSGHTVNSVVMARALARYWTEARLPAYVLAAAVALARVSRGAHYPSDVLAGVLIGVLAEAFQLPVAPHDCTGPVVYTASCHLSLNATNALVQESVRAFYTGWYRELVTELPRIENGFILPMAGPGLGTRLLPDVMERPDARVQRSTL
jgi:membrane-associated phospholipid phosphatase